MMTEFNPDEYEVDEQITPREAGERMLRGEVVRLVYYCRHHPANGFQLFDRGSWENCDLSLGNNSNTVWHSLRKKRAALTTKESLERFLGGKRCYGANSGYHRYYYLDTRKDSFVLFDNGTETQIHVSRLPVLLYAEPPEQKKERRKVDAKTGILGTTLWCGDVPLKVLVTRGYTIKNNWQFGIGATTTEIEFEGDSFRKFVDSLYLDPP